jgi:hypothetical protein
MLTGAWTWVAVIVCLMLVIAIKKKVTKILFTVIAIGVAVYAIQSGYLPL